jgi:hypothetical protein
MLRIPVKPRTGDQLNLLMNPGSAGLPESVPAVMFDTQTYVAAGQTRLVFFGASVADRTLASALGNGGQIADPQAFLINAINLDIFSASTGVTTSATTDGIISSIEKILKAARGVLTLTISQKNYPPVPITYCHASGGAVGVVSSTVATVSQQFGSSGPPTGGFYLDNSIIIPPKVDFSITIDFQATLVTIAADLLMRVSLPGVLYRRIL